MNASDPTVDDPTTAAPGGRSSVGGRTVARIGYGAMQLTRLREHPEQAVALIRRAVELGIDHVDTAQFYGNGIVNEFLREALSTSPEVLIAS